MEIPRVEQAETVEEWIAKACGSKDFTKYLHVQGNMLYGTDRRRIHYAATTMPDGAYDPETLNHVRCDDDVPAMIGLVHCAGTEVTLEEMYIGHEGAKRLECARVPNGPAFRIQHFADALNGFDKNISLFHDGTRLMGVNPFGCFMIGRCNKPAE